MADENGKKATRSQIEQELLRGKSVAQIIAEFGVSRTEVEMMSKKMYGSCDRNSIERKIAAGNKDIEIATQCGIDVGTVALHRENLAAEKNRRQQEMANERKARKRPKPGEPQI